MMRGHTRNRSSTALGSSESPKEKRSKPSQKAMLSKALAKANTAVQLDNAQNYEGARESYIEACELLQQVLARTTGEEDRNKLEAIRGTYTSRIDELDGMIPVQPPSDKELPARPESFDYAGAPGVYSSSDDEQDDSAVQMTVREAILETLVTNLYPGVRRKHIRGVSGGTEAEFDAALDAAVEAAYDDGYEPMDSIEMTYDGDDDDQDDVVANTMRKVEIAKERVRQTERESAIEFAREKERQRQMSTGGDSQTFGVVYDGNDSDEEEEERMLDELTKDYVMSSDYSFAFRDKSAPGLGGLYLFESEFHLAAPHSPNSLNQWPSEAPLPLEPCPADAMLRPFWLMRALYQTLAHPKGGYLTNRLFIPRDAWKVKGVKLRALEDKMAQCDLLTAALLKLARVDSTDADAVLEEMQSFENILETVQNALSRKLGNEVGTNGISTDKDGEQAMPAVPRSASVSGKGAFSWRRLRSKGSAVNLTSAYGSKSSSGNGGNNGTEKDVSSVGVAAGSGSIPSLPMVAQPCSRPAKRDVTSVRFDGPYGGYMASLARLFDAAQTVDQIARQVDDPGLRHADKTQVGLELCTRHAAEFFGFYICRFVMLDVSMLMDKFVKRGSEWVLN
ncbi:putative mit domain-containing protein [Eutypa lata UCREL1]|uniref:Putative mit domain-containing protein n=1 Tax=Eutypa lata (strain UCR-EL1) TaxID=1287681 RepID=M7SCM6_EUTLA|nr:putative mit domain-containing protein [Eutypa lata UCREL1]